MKNYEKQGNNFLKKHDVKMIVKFLKHDVYFQDDKKKRDIFKVTFKRQGKQFTITFGQSIIESTGIGENPPLAYDVLACIEKYEPDTFETFCVDYGFDNEPFANYLKVKKNYNAICKQWKQVSSFFTDEELEELKEIN